MKMIRAVWEKEMTPSQERTFIAPPIAVVREEKDDKVHRNEEVQESVHNGFFNLNKIMKIAKNVSSIPNVMNYLACHS